MSWRQIRGHDEVRLRFMAALQSGRLAHAYLFVGPEGVGKKRFAIELAKTLLCERDSNAGDACDQCAGCRLVDADTHPDLVVTGKPADKHEFPIAVIQELVSGLGLKPARGRRRITVVDDADLFNEESANCFLKTLEEPPPGSLLILIGTEAAFQLPTIRSRCQVIPFDALADEIVEERLRAAGIADLLQLKSIVRIAAGSPGHAIALADPAVWPIRRQILDTLTSAKPDGPALAKAWQESIEAAGKETSLQRPRALQLVRLALDIFRLALEVALGRTRSDDNPVESALIQKLAARLGTDGLIDRMERLIETEMHIDRRVQLILAVEAAVDAMTLDTPPALRRESALIA
jgi:DNA polymerase III subunit delta'